MENVTVQDVVKNPTPLTIDPNSSFGKVCIVLNAFWELSDAQQDEAIQYIQSERNSRKRKKK